MLDIPLGLTTVEARRRLDDGGPNTIADVAQHPLMQALKKLWAPVPWMLEAAILLQLWLGDDLEAGVVALLLIFNAALGFLQESRARKTLDALKSRLALVASARRDGTWAKVPAADLVPGDVVKLSLGGIVPADMLLIEGSILLDQSMLTGESVSVEATAGVSAYAGALVRRGEALGEVTATGERTRFGRTAQLIRNATVESVQQKTVLGIVRNLVLFNGAATLLLVAYAMFIAMPIGEIVPLMLVSVLFLLAGLMITGHAILTPTLVVFIMVTGDFLDMSSSSDNVVPSPTPNVWRTRNLMLCGIVLGLVDLVFYVACLIVGEAVLGLDTAGCRRWRW